MLYPMFMMVILTIMIGCIAFTARVKSVKTGKVKARSYKLMDAEAYPEDVVKTTRNFNNQFEIPVLFYVVCLLFMTLDINNQLGLVLAWSFVGLRFIHALIHITYNKLTHRLLAFWLGGIVVLGLWLTLITEAVQRGLV